MKRRAFLSTLAAAAFAGELLRAEPDLTRGILVDRKRRPCPICRRGEIIDRKCSHCFIHELSPNLFLVPSNYVLQDDGIVIRLDGPEFVDLVGNA